MCPIDTSGTLRDANPGHNGYDFEVRDLLTKRFGTATANELVNTYYDAWIGRQDLDNIKALGLNAVRLTLSYDLLLENDGAWRPDAFRRIDWLVHEAWKRGIYTILDFHAWLPPGAHQDGSGKGYWSSEAEKTETVSIWTKLAAHFKGNPAVAMYDLLNEPTNSVPQGKQGPTPGAVCDLYDRLYHAIRSVDPGHAIAMEGVWGWDTLRDPAASGYENVVYSFHWYNWGCKTVADQNKATDNNVDSMVKMQQKWNVPAFIGEFNLFGSEDAWKYALDQYHRHGLSWTLWTYKNKAEGMNSWGLYTVIPGHAPAVPNLATDTADEIRARWKAWATSTGTFQLNPMLEPLFKH
jgi:aryl-phospho-beta-D-glucosidase BglC (GH1 family)